MFPALSGASSRRVPAFRSSTAFAPRTRGERSRRSALKHLGFGQARLSARFDLPSRLRADRGESSSSREPTILAPATRDSPRYPARLVVLFGSGLGCRGSGVSAGQRRPNKSFKPNPLRYAKHMAGKACHVFRFTTLLGLTLVLGLVSGTVGARCSVACRIRLNRHGGHFARAVRASATDRDRPRLRTGVASAPVRSS